MKNLLKIKPLSILFVAFMTFSISSCGLKAEADEAGKYVEDFYKKMKDNDYEAMLEMVDEEGLKASTEDQWLAVFKQKEALGEFEGYDEGLGWHTSINNGVTKVQVDYTTHYADFENVYERFVLVKRGEEFKILSYQYNENKSSLQDVSK